MSRDLKIGILGVVALTLVLLAYALHGRPPYAFFSILKWAVVVAAGLGAWAVFTISGRHLPISLCLVLLGGIHLFGRMRRSEWALFDWGALVGLSVAMFVLTVDLLRRRPNP